MPYELLLTLTHFRNHSRLGRWVSQRPTGLAQTFQVCGSRQKDPPAYRPTGSRRGSSYL